MLAAGAIHNDPLIHPSTRGLPPWAGTIHLSVRRPLK